MASRRGIPSTPNTLWELDKEVDETWKTKAVCATDTDPDLFFDEERGTRKSRRAWAEKLCAKCPVTQECLQYSFDVNATFGVWGGKSALERKRLKEQQAS